jgi:hypothetical protein
MAFDSGTPAGGPNGIYDPVIDDVDDPNHPGFIVRIPGGSGPTVGGEVMFVNKSVLLTQQLLLPVRLMMGLIL